jgi:microcystin-dependent protein
MANPFVAEIRIFPFNFAPTGWAFCDGQILPISQNTALFSLLGTTYGGDGKSNFALPNLQGSAPMHIGGAQPGPGLSLHDLGESAGSDTVTLIESEIPAHNHAVQATGQNALQTNPGPSNVLSHSNGGFAYQTNTTQNLVNMDGNAISVSGGDQPHNNLQPYLTLNFCIAMQGVFPPRS